MNDWLTPDLKRSIAHEETRRLTWPASQPCPVTKGDRFQIRRWLTIEIEKVTKQIRKDRSTEWQAEFIRHEADRPQLLRRTPAGLPLQPHEMAGLTEIERARRDGNYTSSPGLALIKEPESVGPDWHDPGVAEREQKRKQEREELELERREQAARAALGRITAGLSIEQRRQVLASVELAIQRVQADQRQAA